MERIDDTPGFFTQLFRDLIGIMFIRGTNTETVESLREHNVPADGRPRQGMQVWFQYSYEERRVVVYTTYSALINGPKDKRQGWVLIFDKDGDVMLYSFPILKSASFFNIMFSYAKAFQDLVKHWPKCPQCGKDLSLVHVKKILHVKRFECRTPHKEHRHTQRRPEIWIFDLIFLQPENYHFLRSKYLPVYKKELKRIAAGDAVGVKKHLERSEKKKTAHLKEIQTVVETYYDHTVYNDRAHLD